MSFATLQAAWAEWLIDGLVAAGVHHVVVSPGSRSTPLVLAIARAEAAGRVQATVIVDERSAAFFALGQARVTGMPSLLVCTSGTAGAHYLPAVIEAAEARIPLLVLTADRPFELRGRGASQTIEQTGMFGRFVRRAFEIGMADSDPGAVDGLVRTAALAAHASRWPDPGPVHLNVAFRKPLEPDDGDDAVIEGLRRRVADVLATDLAVAAIPRVVPSAAALDASAALVRAAPRGLLLLGPSGMMDAAGADSVAALARATGYPVLAEATSQHRFGPTSFEPALDVFEPLFGSGTFLDAAAPELVLQVGSASTGRALGSWIAGSGVRRIVLARHGYPEAFNQATQVVLGELDSALAGLADRLAEPVVDAGWADAIARAAARARRLAAEAAAAAGSQGRAVREAVNSVPAGGLLMVGNSMPVRDVDLYAPAGARRIGVVSQRGAAGIDGLISGAAGAAAASARPTLLLLGDVSFQHDVGGLAAAAAVDVPLAIVIVANGGGRLFELLPVRDLPAPDSMFERFFLTASGLAAEDVARAFGLPGVRVDDLDALPDVLATAMTRPGATVIEAVVDGHGADAVRHITAAFDASPASGEGCFQA